jgi:hypothetical protein
VRPTQRPLSFTQSKMRPRPSTKARSTPAAANSPHDARTDKLSRTARIRRKARRGAAYPLRAVHSSRQRDVRFNVVAKAPTNIPTVAEMRIAFTGLSCVYEMTL